MNDCDVVVLVRQRKLLHMSIATYPLLLSDQCSTKVMAAK